MKFNRYENQVALGLVILAIITRLLPHPPNFAPITSIGLFAGFNFVNKRLALLLPLTCMFVTDLYLGLHSLMPIVYAAFGIISYIGLKAKSITFFTVFLASVTFFVITNLGVWYFYYPRNFSGLSSCFVLAIPFFVNALAGDLFYSSLLQFSFKKLKKISLISL